MRIKLNFYTLYRPCYSVCVYGVLCNACITTLYTGTIISGNKAVAYLIKKWDLRVGWLIHEETFTMSFKNILSTFG